MKLCIKLDNCQKSIEMNLKVAKNTHTKKMKIMLIMGENNLFKTWNIVI